MRFSDLAAMMEVVHHFLCKADEAAPEGYDIKEVLKKAVSLFDGGFHVAGLIGNGMVLYSVMHMAFVPLIIILMMK